MAASLPPVEQAKRLAAYAAVDRHIGLKHKVRSQSPWTDGVR